MSVVLVDSHCHLPMLSQAGREGGVDEVLRTAAENGVGLFLCVCVDDESRQDVLDTARRYPQVYATVGLHPNSATQHEPTAAEIASWAAHPRVIAIGETGLDYFRSEGDLEWQRQRFREHIRAARLCGKPVIVHMRDAAEDALSILREEQVHEVGGIMHCFTGDYSTACEAIRLNLLISFSGIVTFRSATVLQEVAKRIPLESMLLETDCPYLAPVPVRGKENQPAYVRHVAEFIAALRGVPYETIAMQTTKNFKNLFKEITVN